VAQAPIAFGKTVLAAKLMQARMERGERSIFVAPALSLIDQTVDRFYQYGLRDIGVIQAQHVMTAPDRLIQIASAQTLMRRNIPTSSLVMIDECHLRFGFVSKWMAEPAWKAVPFVGLSATPWSIGMGRDWKKLIVAATMRDMASQGWLKRLRYYAPVEIDASNIKIIAGDYHEGELSAVSRTRTILSNTVRQWMERANGRPTIAFCVDRAHAQDMQSRFLESGIPCGYIDGHTDALERQRIGKQLESGEIRVVTSVGCLIAGLDWTFVNCILFAVKTKSKIKWVQGIGRGMRLHPGQEDCLLLDCAGNSHLGHPYDIQQEWLDEGDKGAMEKRKKEKEEQKEPRKCSQCGALWPAGLPACPECGFIPKKPSDVIELNANLREMGTGGKVLEEGKKVAYLDHQLWYSSFKAIAKARGYKDGWAASQYKEKFKEWPDMKAIHDVALGVPAPEVSSWIKHRMIKFAKGRQKARA
jgi:superfamily II DNA or RNA helicase